ncbi:Cell division cycle 5-like protein [Hibiscus syriacus]|uniref:Cell division cycle 5-like protein n=1 Tax=Hibiscus syriacus TaxID=106335 RepID=A0A6A3CYJ5_HIBSY|nr:Cell division cycle 5-like protein [Hibiscus syriacus]
MSDRIARERAEEEARYQALLKKRSKVLQRELPRPPSASLELIRDSLLRTDGDKSSFVPPTLIEQADELIRKELLSLLEHDNAKYPLDEKANKEKKKGSKRSSNGSVPSIEIFEEDEMKEADSRIKEEAEYLHMAMGHENESLDDFVEAHNTCLNDFMYFPTRHAYGLSSVAGNAEKLAALHTEFDNVKRKMDNDKSKAEGVEKKYSVLTQGYERRAATLWRQIESTVNQIDTAGTELECFQALQKQEQLAASHRINGLWEEVQKQKELEQTLQKRYGNLLAEMERMQKLMDLYRVQAQRQDEAAEKDRAFEPSEAAASQDAVPSLGLSEPAPSSEDVDSTPDGQPNLKVDMNVDLRKEQTTMDTETDGSMSGNEDNTIKATIGDGVTSSKVASESVNPDAAFSKQESIKETPEGEGFIDHIKIG